MLARLRLDPFTLALLGAVLLAAFLPASGRAAAVLDVVADLAIAALFFLHGARLPRAAVVGAIKHWRLHLFALAVTFGLFPALGLFGGLFLPGAIGQPLYTGVLYLCILSSTVQTSITLTSIAGGNVAAAVSAATLSNVLGMFLTPVLAGIFLATEGGGMSLSGLGSVLLQLLLPFVLGQALQPWIGTWVSARRKLFSYTDRGSVVLVVYLAFSRAVIAGVWRQLSPMSFAILLATIVVLLAIVLSVIRVAARLLGFNRADEATLVFCGSQKSLVSGIPIANVLFTGAEAGIIVLPLMIYHQLQLLTGAVLARGYARANAAKPPT